MREICLHDTRSGELRPLAPRDPGRVGIYACGPTVYGRIHVGNARPFVVFALLARFLEHEGYEVLLVENITDISRPGKLHKPSADDLAFIQFSSGSTSEPVVITRRQRTCASAHSKFTVVCRLL